MVQKALDSVGKLKDEMVNALSEMCKIPAIAPESGGDGELDKANYLKNLSLELGFDKIALIKAEDSRVSCGFRPNLIVSIPGKNKDLPPLWIVSHMDIVPEGDRDLWDSDPFDPVIRGGRLFGRGVEDNGQALIASLYAAKGLLKSGTLPKRK